MTTKFVAVPIETLHCAADICISTISSCMYKNMRITFVVQEVIIILEELAIYGDCRLVKMQNIDILTHVSNKENGSSRGKLCIYEKCDPQIESILDCYFASLVTSSTGREIRQDLYK